MTDLPIHDVLPDLLGCLSKGENAVLVAPPGAGKTTMVPLALLAADWLGGDRIVMLEPRRIAARAAATRMAALLGEAVGQTVGYRTRLDSAVSAVTRVEVVTEGLLVRRLLADPGLTGVAAVILDEVHERSVDGDLAMALCRDLQTQFRPELRLVAMSATIDAQRLAALLEAPVIASEGRLHPVEVRQSARDLAGPRELPEAMARAIRGALATERGDILAFLPGMAEIRRTEQALAGCGALVLPLHGELPAAEQDRALRVGDTRRVVLATSIAETSLTVPGVRIVVDGGWRRAPRMDAASGLTRLSTLRISRAAADQRAGRAGREAPGVAIRLWTPAFQRGLAPFDRPEMVDADLAGLVLDCAGWGTAPGDLPFLDAPPAGAVAAAGGLLRSLGLLADDRLTEMGRQAARLGAHPRLAAMMLAARSPAEAALAADIAALLEERDPLRAPDVSAAIDLRLEALGSDRAGADRATLSRIRQAAAQYRRRLRVPGGVLAGGDPARLIAAGFPDRIAQRRGEPGTFRLSGGGGARLSRADPLAAAPLLAVAALELKTASQIRLGAPLRIDALPDAVAAGITETVESGFDEVAGQVLSRRRRRLGALVLEDRMVAADPAETARVLAAAAARRGLPWSDAARQLQARVERMRALEAPEGAWPDFSDAALAATAGEWLAPHLDGITRLVDVERCDLEAILRQRLEWRQVQRLDQALPGHLPLPGGRAAIDYLQPVPVAAARAQAFYGLAETPRLADGRVPLQLSLLSPAGRPIAITADLAGFWQGAWREVRKDMRGRYPRHNWPEQPANG
jgi:ATP-dependent helicase HrpB